MGGKCCAESHEKDKEVVDVKIGTKSAMPNKPDQSEVLAPEKTQDLTELDVKEADGGGARVHKAKVGEEYTVTIAERNGLKLGIDTCTSKFYPVLNIIKVKPDGLISAWNRLHPDCEVMEGDDLVEVNGVRQDKEKICQLLAKAEKLELHIQRNQ